MDVNVSKPHPTAKKAGEGAEERIRKGGGNVLVSMRFSIFCTSASTCAVVEKRRSERSESRRFFVCSRFCARTASHAGKQAGERRAANRTKRIHM